MGVKYFCDGCHDETDDKYYVVSIMTIKEIQAILADVDLAARGTLAGSPGYYLCDSCLAQLRRTANPKAWSRAHKAA